MNDTPFDVEAFRDFERAAHNRIAGSYQAFFEPVTQHAVDLLLDMAQVVAGTQLLDVATGPGGTAAKAAARGALVTGVDLAPQMVALAAQRYPTIAFRVADVETLPFEGGCFDAVVCNFGLGHFPRPPQAVAECVRVLRPGGMLSLSWWDVPSRTRLQGILIEAQQEVGVIPPPDLPPGPPMYRFSADDELAGLLSSACLIQVVVQTHSFTHQVATPEALWTGALGSLARTAATIREQTIEIQQRVRTVFERLVQTYTTEEGVALPMVYKIAAGRKP
jgi:SAM-dependent methyltransferase